MLTRSYVTHQYGAHPDDYSPPPHHVYMHAHQYPVPSDRARLYGPGGGLMGAGAVSLATRGGEIGSVRGNTGYGYLGMDPSDPATWRRPFSPQPGMIAYLNFGCGPS